MKDDEEEEWERLYDLECWHCERFHSQPQCKGKVTTVKSCVSFDPWKEEKKYEE